VPRSPRLQELVDRIGVLRQLLPPPGQVSYTQTELDRTLGFRLLAHAEIESCIEDLAMNTVNRACKGWMLDRQPRQSILALLAYHGHSLPAVPDTLGDGASDSPLRTRIEDCKKSFGLVVNKNNGVTERDVLGLLLPAGILESDMSQLWLSTISSFGKARGDAAHQRYARLQVQQPPDPGDEGTTVDLIVAELDRIDEVLQRAEAPVAA
jgi:hypothetical protein